MRWIAGFVKSTTSGLIQNVCNNNRKQQRKTVAGERRIVLQKKWKEENYENRFSSIVL